MPDLGIDDIAPSLTPAEKTATLRQVLQSRSGVYHEASNGGDDLPNVCVFGVDRLEFREALRHAQFGPLAATVTVGGWVPPGEALTRSGAKPGDDLWISGTPGDAGAGLAILQSRLAAGSAAREELLRRFLLPEPRVSLGQALRGIASACIDISDGLAGDLAKLCRASGVGARLDCPRLPRSRQLIEAAGEQASMRYALSGGDDYELLFTAPAAAGRRIEDLARLTPVSRIGEITATPGMQLQGAGPERDLVHGFDHFTD